MSRKRSKPVEPFNFKKRGGRLIVIIQDAETKKVLMHGFARKNSLRLTAETGEVWLWSTSRRKLWHKGATSNSKMRVVSAAVDCDGDALLLQVEVLGNGLTCHLGRVSCFVPLDLASLKSE